jgi:hypothetical protein
LKPQTPHILQGKPSKRKLLYLIATNPANTGFKEDCLPKKGEKREKGSLKTKEPFRASSTARWRVE